MISDFIYINSATDSHYAPSTSRRSQSAWNSDVWHTVGPENKHRDIVYDMIYIFMDKIGRIIKKTDTADSWQ